MIGQDMVAAGRIEAEENLVIDAQFLLQDAIAERGISRADLSRLTGLSKARISQLLSAEANPTLRNLAKLFHALDIGITVARKDQVAVAEVAHTGVSARLAERAAVSEQAWDQDVPPPRPAAHVVRDRAVAKIIEQARQGARAADAYCANDNVDVDSWASKRRYAR